MENINQSSVNKGFSEYFKDPEKISASDDKSIESLIEKYPYAQILHAFEAKCHSDDDRSEMYLEKAALYIPERNVLYNVIHKPETFSVIPETISQQPELEKDYTEPSIQEYSDNSDNFVSLEQPEHETEKLDAVDEIKADEEITEHAGPSNLEQIELAEDTTEAEQETTAPAEGSAVSYEEQPAEENNGGSEDISDDLDTADLSPEATGENVFQPDSVQEEVATTEDQSTQAQSADETEKLIIGNIAAADFFRFEEKLDDQLTPQQGTGQTESPREDTAPQEISGSTKVKGVSKYDDDKMPYTFLWWLNKTRQEHSATYQPYVSFKLDTTEDIKKAPTADLNQQIIENIFHLQSPLENIEEQEKPKTVEFTVKRKDEQIIERFIREEPQIRPPKPEKLDTENKARKSSEDSYDMVSETLANVYIEQMLFHKAIDTYKKLSLKFPEKSAYFADQIRKLETTN